MSWNIFDAIGVIFDALELLGGSSTSSDKSHQKPQK